MYFVALAVHFPVYGPYSPMYSASMGKTRVMSIEEIQARDALISQGQDPDSMSAQTILSLRNELATVREKLMVAENASANQPRTPAEIRKNLEELLKHYEVSPAEELIKAALLKDGKGNFILPLANRVSIWEGLMQYTQPKLRAIEHSGKVDTTINVKIVQYNTQNVISEKTVVVKELGG